MREIISLHIGQAGVQIGNACWQLFCQEHGINPTGTMESQQSENQSCSPLFYETPRGQYVPRTIFVDLEPTVIDEIKASKYKGLFKSSQLISDKEDSADNFGRGKYTIGRLVREQVSDSIRKLADNCDNLQGLMVFNSLGGGTGSGVGCLMLERMAIDYGKKSRVGFKVFPSPRQANTVVEPYNAVMGMTSVIEHQTSTFCFDNHALYDLCVNKLGIQSPNYANINRLIAQVASSVTAPMRFQGTLNTSLQELETNLIPYPRVHFLIPSHSLLTNPTGTSHRTARTQNLTSEVFSTQNQMVKCHPENGKYMACSLLFRGDVTPREAIQSVLPIRSHKTVNFVDWCLTGFKVSLNNRPSLSVDSRQKQQRSLSLISNNSSINQVFASSGQKFDRMYAKRAFVHWFVGQGLESCQMPCCREQVACLEKDYLQVTRQTTQEQQQD